MGNSWENHRVTALVGGGGIAVAHLLLLGPSLWQGFGFGWFPGVPGGVFTALALFVGYAAIAYGLPRAGSTWRPSSWSGGLIGSGRLAPAALLAAGLVGVAITLVTTVVSPGPDFWFSPVGRVFSWSIEGLGWAAVVLLVVAAVASGRSPGASVRTVLALRLLAALELLQLAFQWVFAYLVATFGQSVAGFLTWEGWFFQLAALAVGVWIAWPGLAPLVHRGGGAAARARDRWIDSTP